MARQRRPIAIDLFAGAGGLSLGFEQAGFDVVAAVEVDPIHCAIHQFNFPHCAVVPRSVAEVSAIALRQAAKLGDRPVDVVFGGAPCQGFSLMGQRVLDDPRNRLVREFVRLVAELDSSYFVFENVKGLTVGRHRQFLHELIDEFEAKGYEIKLPWQVLNAASFGVPQSRERLILMGAKKGLPLPNYPEPKTRPAGSKENGLPEGPSCYEALQDLPNADEFDLLKSQDWIELVAERWRSPSAYGQQMRCLEGEGWFYGYRRPWNERLLTSSFRTNHTDISRRRFAETRPGEVEPVSRFFRLPPGGVSNTLRAGTDAARGAFTSPRPIHYEHDRCITVREMARLHGFPDWFRLHGTKWHGARQVGNAVPVPLGRVIAAELIQILGHKPTVPKQAIALGEAELTAMEMSQAARYWQIEVPIARRDRKSGVTKRSQEEVEATRATGL